MKKLIMFGAALVAASLVASALLATSAGATAGASETILLKRDANRAEIGWSAAGAFTDAGSWTTDFVAFGGGPSHVFAGTVKTTEAGAQGSFQINFQIHGDGGKDFSGTWQIAKGTGAYANLSGGGTWTHADLPNGDGLFTCTGQVRLDG